VKIARPEQGVTGAVFSGLIKLGKRWEKDSPEKKSVGLPRERAIPFPIGGAFRPVAGPARDYSSVL